MSNDDAIPKRPALLSRALFFVHQLPASDRLLFHILLAMSVLSGLVLVALWSFTQAQPVPAHDGILHEGMVGSVRFINPVLANTRADRDLTALVYQGILRVDQDGELVPDLARTVDVNEDGTEYQITLRQDASFHDGRPVTARDVVYTYQLAQEPELMSPQRGNWSNVEIEQIDTFSVRLTLSEPYHPFQENLTLGILPAHIWEDIPTPEILFSTRNTNPIGSGPYRVQEVHRDDEGSIRQITLEAHGPLNKPIRTIVVRLHDDLATLLTNLSTGAIDTTAALGYDDAAELDQTLYKVHKIPLPRVVALIYNQNRSPALRNPHLRQALEIAIDRQAIIDAIPNETGIPTQTPIPAGYSMLESSATSSPQTPTSTASTTAAIDRLQAGNWEQTDDGVWVRETDDGTIPLELTIRTLDRPNFSAAAMAVAAAWEAIGVEVTVEEFEQRDLIDGVIRMRDFEVLLFGMDVTRSVDLYPFWHSSQQSDPGQNIAQYANISVDSYLQTLRTTADPTERQTAQQSFVDTIAEEQPALFLYTPSAVLIAKNDISLTLPRRVQSVTDRWRSIDTWHNSTENVWPWLHTYLNTNTSEFE